MYICVYLFPLSFSNQSKLLPLPFAAKCSHNFWQQLRARAASNWERETGRDRKRGKVQAAIRKSMYQGQGQGPEVAG